MHILILENHSRAPAGQLLTCLDARGWSHETLCPNAPVTVFPEDLRAFDGVVALGGMQDGWDDASNPRFQEQMLFLRQCDQAGIPVLGICLGAQLLARAYGAAVHPMANGPERGLVAMDLTRTSEVGRRLFADAKTPITVMSWHQDMFQVPEGAEVFLSSGHCPHQGFFVGKCSYGLQFHPEATRDIVQDWISESPHWQARMAAVWGAPFAAVLQRGCAVINAWFDYVDTQTPAQ